MAELKLLLKIASKKDKDQCLSLSDPKQENKVLFLFLTLKVINLHYMLSKAQIKSRPNILWCYKKELGFSTDDRSRHKELKKKSQQKKKQNPDSEKAEEIVNDPFHLFLSATDIRFCYFKETQNILGQTYGMLVLQDFEGITPNILARTIETVEGGGIILFLLPEMNSLKQLYTMAMDVHTRYRTDSQSEVVGRFNERFLLSLATCKNCLVVDDTLNILPLSSSISKIEPIITEGGLRGENHVLTDEDKELMKLKESLVNSQPIGPLISLARTLDQGKAFLQFSDAISEKNLQTTVTLTASRGRGKSASLGMAIVSAIAFGYSNIFVT
jgi:N-acetyltransferase 10